ncbi:WD repeat/BOP1NT protein [Schizosaccharomyces japonicus yFS275]|uniref:Ribosome biogenesis protein ERB1 n=1 Tax=Schizosaccharomyces japonicus (strain yFS275 / FY16936) TaxID=402676 RepID=B6K1A5_SCHJY|nr:WD repeat/BOP1NT protein [Schizosaccharomyces japonicus yFS275]EEB07726.1 WD repeat/BOP1NT protein [Schizosaccharomyces japonicus yFS275]
MKEIQQQRKRKSEKLLDAVSGAQNEKENGSSFISDLKKHPVDEKENDQKINEDEDEDEVEEEEEGETSEDSFAGFESEEESLPELSPDVSEDESDIEEIDAGYSSDSSTEDGPARLYESPNEPGLYINYDIDGKRITRPATPAALDSLIASMDKGSGWTGIVDTATGQPVNLTDDEMKLLKRLAKTEIPEEGFNVYEDAVDFFTHNVQQTPVSSAPEPKSRFAPSKHERKRILQLAYAIKKGRILTAAQREELERKESERSFVADKDLWADDSAVNEMANHPMYAPAPRLPPPTHDESYNPPEEYLPTPEEAKAYEEADPEDRPKNYLPRKHNALRLVPAYKELLKERFERCLDLYLAPRVRRKKLNIDPESLIPKLPLPSELRPFPTRCTNAFVGHKGRVRSLDAHREGLWLASGGDDGVVRVWEILTGRCVWSMSLRNFNNGETSENDDDEDSTDEQSIIHAVAWSPNTATPILAVAADTKLYLITPPIFNPELVENAKNAVSQDFSESACVWKHCPKSLTTVLSGAVLHAVVTTQFTIKALSWHRRGDYVATSSSVSSNRAVIIHQLSRGASQSPFSKARGSIQQVSFHPTQPYLLVATQRYVRIYNLAKQELVKTLITGVKWISSIDVHPSGDHVLLGSYDRRLCWFDLDLSNKPYKTVRYHDRAIRDVSYHPTLPLFCSASDDGNVQVFHGRVYNDLMANPLIVPLKILGKHKVVNSVGVLDACWHPQEAWLFSCGANGEIRMWT